MTQEINQDRSALILKLRKMTDMGIAMCKDALVDSSWDLQKAYDALNARAGKVSKEIQTIIEGAFGVFENGKYLTVIQLGCSTDFVSRKPEFIEVANEIAEAYAKDPSIMSEEFKKNVVNVEPFSKALKPFGEIIQIQYTQIFDKQEGAVFYMIHRRGKNNIFAAAQITSSDKTLGEAIVTQVMYQVPLCVNESELTEAIKEERKSREVVLLKQECMNESGVIVADFIGCFSDENGNPPKVVKIVRKQMSE